MYNSLLLIALVTSLRVCLLHRDENKGGGYLSEADPPC